MTWIVRHRLPLLLGLALWLVFSGLVLLLDGWVFRALPYEAPRETLQRNAVARAFFARALKTDGYYHTWLGRFRNDRPHPDVVLLNIDYDVISSVDSWPLPRDLVAEIFERLAEQHPRTVVVDMIFEWPQTPWVFEQLRRQENLGDKQLAALLDAFDHDRRLKGALEKNRYVLIDLLVSHGDFIAPAERQKYAANMHQRALAAPPVEVTGEGLTGLFPLQRIVGLRESILPLQLHADGQGYTWFNLDRFGHIAQAPLFHRLQTREEPPRSYFLPHVISEAVRVYLDADGYRLDLEQGAARRFAVGTRAVSTDPAGELTLNFYDRGALPAVPVVRAHDLLEGSVAPESLTGKLVVVGSDTNLLHDYLQTPYGAVWGTEVVALGISNLLNGDALVRPPWAGHAEIVLMLIALVGISAASLLLRPGWSLAVAVALLAGNLLFVGQAYVARGELLGITLPGAFTLLLYLQHTLLRFVREERQKRTLKNALSLYLSPELTRQVADRPELLGLQGREEILTVLFTDIRNFSSISETMDPEELTAFLQRYFSPMTDIIFDAGGTLDKYIGDAIMAFWGAPVHQPDHPQRAVAAALKMLWTLDKLAGGGREELPPEIGMGIGIHTGSMRVGNMGSERRLNYTVLGDNVNLGSRIEGLTKHYGVRLLVSGATWAQVAADFHGRRIDTVRVKGKEEPVSVYEIRGHGQPIPEEAGRLAAWEAALAAWERRDWTTAREGFEAWRARGDTPAQLYLERIERYAQQAPHEPWPPVTVMHEK